MKRILLTGAGGGIGTHLRRELRGVYALRLSDREPVANLAGDDFMVAELTDFDAVAALMDGMDGIIHMGGYSVEGAWQSILDANIIGCHNVFEAARRSGVKRIIFASSNHACGFYRRDQIIDDRVSFRPDSRYGVSKAFGEALGNLYADKYGFDVLSIRIGNVNDKPLDARRLAIWISPRDLAQLVRIGLDTPDLGHQVVYGVSGNTRSWYDNANATGLGYVPRDNAEDYAAEILADHPENTGDPRADAHQGGHFVTAEEVELPVRPA